MRALNLLVEGCDSTPAIPAPLAKEKLPLNPSVLQGGLTHSSPLQLNKPVLWIHVLEHEGWTEHPEPGTERFGGAAITREGSGQLGGPPERYETGERRCQGVARRPAQAVRVCADGHPSPISCVLDPNSKGRPPPTLGGITPAPSPRPGSTCPRI